ncbi:putative N-acetyltransferase camello [Scleropages formosus]|uniref:Probable N-acetyltransferase CML1 n=1 Tax=Scleropages formosus TaxID=113540 RepID=A0A0N8K2Z9_SCLFO|nr:probable N-acetyltransferase CML1 [Scleropages formosus]XP_029108265.1 probable N-acetyltransferase CML1 [Scleropages formosus]KPP79145.1 putative N-acetyltransferase camello [Scleropages formosus]
MTSFHVRRYRPEDAEAVKKVFTTSMGEHVPSTFLHMLKQPLTQAVASCVIGGLLLSSRSLILPLLASALLVAGSRQLVGYIFTRYIQMCLKKDLGRIQEAYMEPEDRCFWVAESGGCVVATVACLPSSVREECLELKRMAVLRSHRGLGIAKALCRTVADFARQRGYRAVMLYTSVVQSEAQRLYEGMGYARVGEALVPEMLAKLLNFTLIEYRYELPEQNDRRSSCSRK